MGIVSILAVCWLVAYAAAGLPKTRALLTRVAGWPWHAAAPPAGGAITSAPARPIHPAAIPRKPTRAVPEHSAPVREKDCLSTEGQLVAAMLAGSISVDRYHRAMQVLAAQEERAHPMPPVVP